MNAANSTFLVLSSILVFFMTPGLAFFYGGLVSKRNVVNTLLSVFMICGLAIMLWLAFGYSLSFSGNVGGIIGDLKAVWLHGVDLTALTPTKIPNGLYLIFQMMFAIITPALFVGAVVGRIRFKFLLSFIICWSLLIYYPMVHMVWDNGFLASLGVIDFAGGTVVHINAGVTALVLSIFLGPRHKFGEQPEQHYNVLWVLLGTAILWIGWYGFNAGSALAMNDIAVQAFLTTTVATATSMMTWMVVDMLTKGKPTLVGVCTGTLCGLVGITPACGYVTVSGAFWIGLVATLTSYAFISVLKPRLGIDDALDAFGCHGVSGIVGSILTGLFASKQVNGSIALNGLFYGGGFKLFGLQLLATAFTIIFTAVVCSVIIVLLRRVVKMRVDEREEALGLDQGEHGEVADYTVPMSKELSDIQHHSDEFKGQLSQLMNHRERFR
ncbi:ammonium transporter [Lactiplantibacillus garii]|uniref:Ammonium transporter n=1 Tax=Lactiplantibacillus garii TaxID=2306423 RepID=A0A426D9G0_9LACO|nr:ammonium transporter [Lactiplantibacillus garii]RRK11250.1 ammonium transporter [Lactiplantibacillus garii]